VLIAIWFDVCVRESAVDWDSDSAAAMARRV
jgi:hypothetical protein